MLHRPTRATNKHNITQGINCIALSPGINRRGAPGRASTHSNWLAWMTKGG